MIRINSFRQIQSVPLIPDMKDYLIRKYEAILSEYNLDDIDGIFSIIYLDTDDVSYIYDKLLEFFEELILGNSKYIHTVWVPSDGYSEDILIPYTSENWDLVVKKSS